MPDVNAPEPGQRRVFLSHAQPAKDVARRIPVALRTSGFCLVRGVGTGCRRLHSGAN